VVIGERSPKKKNRRPDSAAETLDRMQSAGDRLAEWLEKKRTAILVILGLLLVGAAGYGYWSSAQADLQEAASIALARAHQGFMADMGASPSDILPTEPANPETATRVRREYVAIFAAVRSDHPGTPESQVAALQQGDLEQALGDSAAAEATWVGALSEGAPSDGLRGLILLRVAAAREAAGDWPAAAAFFEEAGGLSDFPLRSQALGDAARCYAEAGDDAMAIATYDRASGAEGRPLPVHIRSRIEELRAALSR